MSANAVGAAKSLEGRDLEIHELVSRLPAMSSAVCLNEGVVNKIRMLLEGNANPNLSLSDSDYGLIDGAIDHPQVVQLLLNAKANPTRSTLGLALRSERRLEGRDAMMRSLLEARAPIGDESLPQSIPRVETAIFFGHSLDTIKLLVQNGARVKGDILERLGGREDIPITPQVRNFLNANLHPVVAAAVQASAAAALALQPEGSPQLPAQQAVEPPAIPAPAQQAPLVVEEQLQDFPSAFAKGKPSYRQVEAMLARGVLITQPKVEDESIVRGDLDSAIFAQWPDDLIELLMVHGAKPFAFNGATLRCAETWGRSERVIGLLKGTIQPDPVRREQAAPQAAARPEPAVRLPAPRVHVEPAQNDPLPPMQGPQQLPQAAPSEEERQEHYCSCFVGILPEFMLNGIDAVCRFFVGIGRGITSCLNWVFVH